MTDIKQEAGQDAAKNAAANPANPNGLAVQEPVRRRIPLSVPRRKLEVAPIPGYVLYWFLEGDIITALEGGYEFVDRTEVRLNQRGLANSTDDSGNTDLGSRVSVLGNKFNEQGKPERHVLMKIKEEWWREDRTILDNANAATVEAIFGPEHRIAGGDKDAEGHATSYVKEASFGGTGGMLDGRLPRQKPILNRGLPKKA